MGQTQEYFDCFVRLKDRAERTRGIIVFPIVLQHGPPKNHVMQSAVPKAVVFFWMSRWVPGVRKAMMPVWHRSTTCLSLRVFNPYLILGK